nr:terminase small subunit protein [Bradyrhizobium retamae]
MAEGVSLRSICLADDMPDKATVFRWLAAHKEFRDQYARAREARADAMAEEILEISDDDSDDAITDPETGATRINAEFVARSRLKVDTRKWLMARMAPKVYGDKVTQELQGPDGGAIKTISKIELVAAPFPAGMGEE